MMKALLFHGYKAIVSGKLKEIRTSSFEDINIFKSTVVMLVKFMFFFPPIGSYM